MTSGGKYLSTDDFEKAVAEFFGGDTGKVQAVMVLAAKAGEGSDGIYILKNPYGKRSKAHRTSFDVFRESLAGIGEEGVVGFICNRFPGFRVKVAKAIAGASNRLALTPGDDARVTAELEKRLRSAVGKDAFRLAREELLRLVPALPPDESGQMVMAAMDLVVVNYQINRLDAVLAAEFEKDGGQRTKEPIDQKKQLLIRKDDLMKRLGLDSADILKRGGPKGGSLASAAEALKAKIGDRLATADLAAEAEKIDATMGKQMPEVRPVDEIDLAVVKELAAVGQ